MTPQGRSYLRVTADAVREGTTVRYYYRDGSSLAAVTERSEEFVTFVGEDCDGRFTHDQIDELIEDGRLEIVLGAGPEDEDENENED